MQTMKNKVGQKLAKSWPEKSLIRVGQKVDEVWMAIGQLLVKSWSAFKAKEVGRKLDKTWTDFHPFRVCQGYAKGMPELRSNKLLQPYSSITPKIAGKLLQVFSNTSPEIGSQRLHHDYTNPTPEFKQFSLKNVTQRLPNDYPENEDFSLEASGQNQDEIGIKILRYRFGKIAVTWRWFVGEMSVEYFVKGSSRVRQFEGYQVGQFLGETGMDLRPFYLGINTVIQPLSSIAHSLIVHNKRVSYGYTKVTPALHQEFSLFDIAKLFLYVVLPDQRL